jgi:plasmid stability protein
MAALVIRTIPDAVHAALRRIAADRHLLVEAVAQEALAAMARRAGRDARPGAGGASVGDGGLRIAAAGAPQRCVPRNDSGMTSSGQVFVGAVAERLLAAFAAGAPPIGFSGLDLDLVGSLLGDDRQ